MIYCFGIEMSGSAAMNSSSENTVMDSIDLEIEADQE